MSFIFILRGQIVKKIISYSVYVQSHIKLGICVFGRQLVYDV